MKPIPFLLLLGLAAPAWCADKDALSEVRQAFKTLAEKPNYSWTTTQQSEGGDASRPGAVEGKTEQGGWTFVVLPFNGQNVEFVFKGQKAALNRDGEWQSTEELESGSSPWIGRMLRAFKAPAEEGEDMVGQVKGLKRGPDGVYAGEFTGEGAKAIMSRRARPGSSAPADARGSIKFWIEAGLVRKYEYTLQGTLARQDGTETKVNRTTVVEVKSVGTTRLEIPAAAKKKFM
jgi:hypothetical protein